MAKDPMTFWKKKVKEKKEEGKRKVREKEGRRRKEKKVESLTVQVVTFSQYDLFNFLKLILKYGQLWGKGRLMTNIKIKDKGQNTPNANI